MKKRIDFIRQGDIFLKRVKAAPDVRPTKYAQYTIAYGEQTGHHHTLYPKGNGVVFGELAELEPTESIDLFIDANGTRFIKLETDWLLKHEEHKPEGELVTKGVYEIITEREEDPFLDEIKTVVD